jgi:D-beta-D-heptose 7-phosphate kinase/D-beta-D-heptose 1-phosphate adenosyltransferase
VKHLLNVIGRWQKARILVVGDPMVDVYHFGHVDRLSPEAPVPVFVQDRQESRPGGAANVTENLQMLSVNWDSFFPTEQWTEKHRYMVGNHQLLRVDNDRRHNPGQEVPNLKGVDAIVLSDYDKGWLSSQLCVNVIHHANVVGIPVVVDPKGTNWTKYQGCTVICPNTVEATHPDLPMFRTILAKEGPKGLKLIIKGEKFKHFPATAKAVFDVTGAGDTVVAVVACALAAKASLEDAAILANLAAGHVVGQVGTSTCSVERLIDLVRESE